MKAELNEMKIEAKQDLCNDTPYMDMHKNESAYEKQAMAPQVM